MTTSIKEILKARNVINQDLRKISSEDWFRSQPANIKANTIASQLLHQAIIAKNPNEISDALIKCIEQKVWEGMAYMASVPSKRKLISYTPIEWLRQEICIEPDTLMRLIAGVMPDPELTSNASIELINLVAKEEPKTLVILSNNYWHYSNNYMLGWLEIFENLEKFDTSWLKVSLVLNEKIDSIYQGPDDAKNRSSKNNDLASDSISKLVRTLSQLIDDPAKCEAKGTNTFKVSNALDRLLRGITISAEKAKREAGLEKSKKTNCGYSITGKPKNVAGRIIRRLGIGPARRIALAILEEAK